jgi:hypothetical protein
MLNINLLKEFIFNFFGYGNYHSKYWFIGMEEGGGNSIKEVNRRLNAWEKRGKLELEDVAEYHFAIGIPEHFRDPAKLQPTWNKLIRILLSAEGQAGATEDVREYQKSSLGRLNGESCLLELLPLPSPSTGKWLYGQHSSLPYLKTRKLYSETCTPFRAAHIRSRIDDFKPKAVVFYSFSYKDHWQEIAGAKLEKSENGEYFIGENDATLYLITKHPAFTGITNRYFENIGEIIRSSLVK